MELELRCFRGLLLYVWYSKAASGINAEPMDVNNGESRSNNDGYKM